MNSSEKVSVFWFRRDLRLSDNAGLYHALKNNPSVLPLFIFDSDILNKLENRNDKRVEFIHRALKGLKEKLEKAGSSLFVAHGTPTEVFSDLIGKYSIQNVYTNTDYEPYSIARDKNVRELLEKNKITFHSFKDQVIFEKSEIIKEDGKPYIVFTPFMNKWKRKLENFSLLSYATENYFSAFLQTQPFPFPSLEILGFASGGIKFSMPEINEAVILNYNETRNFPSINGTSRISVHLRFGTLSIRQIAALAKRLNEQWLNELIWREFYMMILFHFPHAAHGSFKSKYDRIPWRNDEKDFTSWCNGKTGYPIVDAGMRELNETGFMHNRVRMIVASFLVKHLLIDWRWGEAYFAEKLMDYDLSANNGGWQWAAGSGCDAAPYFRIFNPYEQTKRFDQKHEYIRKWIPELNELNYPQPMVDHKFARERALTTYKKALGNDPDKF